MVRSRNHKFQAVRTKVSCCRNEGFAESCRRRLLEVADSPLGSPFRSSDDAMEFGVVGLKEMKGRDRQYENSMEFFYNSMGFVMEAISINFDGNDFHVEVNPMLLRGYQTDLVMEMISSSIFMWSKSSVPNGYGRENITGILTGYEGLWNTCYITRRLLLFVFSLLASLTQLHWSHCLTYLQQLCTSEI